MPVLPIAGERSDHLSVGWKGVTPPSLHKSNISPHKAHELKLAVTFYQQFWIKQNLWWVLKAQGRIALGLNSCEYAKPRSYILWIVYLSNVIADVY